jgi:hypothetical protein
LFPRDNWVGRKVGEWRADYLGVGAGNARGASFAPVRQGVSARLKHQIPFGLHLRSARQFVTETQRWRREREVWNVAGDGAPTAPVPPTLAGADTRRKSSAWPNRRYAQIAAAYLARLDAGSRRAVVDVANRYRLTPTQVRDAVHRARELGILTPTTQQGRPGGFLTPAGQALLNRRRKNDTNKRRKR